MTEEARRISRRGLLGAAGVFAAGGLLSACGNGNSGKTPSSSRQISVKDQRGDTVVLPHPVTRMVTIPMPAAAIAIAVDQSARHVAGMHDASWLAIKEGILGQMFPEALDIPHDVAGDDFSPNVESILALNPDLVVQWAELGSGLIAPLDNAGLRVLGVTYGTQADLTRWLTLFGDVLGKPQRAKQMNAHIDSQLSAMRSRPAKPPSQRPSIVYFDRFVGGLTVAGTDTYNDFYIKLIGATNPASAAGQHVDGFADVDIEQVLRWDPDIVLLGNFDAALPDDVYSSSVWRGVSAVKQRRIYKVPLGGYRWDPPSQESPLMWHWLSQVAYPGEHAPDLRAMVQSYYQFLYGYATSDHQVDSILRLDVNGRSAHYEQFHA